ncbi:unnamed protein product [Mycena citricolor]|uniref:BHLH domain-containing protein n=1 Tax=Mycena citricolor TaxID=2018698 RepID=A0AAD2HE83_9AGAR|nr:unnamed protein product [Mycena citricolor]
MSAAAFHTQALPAGWYNQSAPYSNYQPDAYSSSSCSTSSYYATPVRFASVSSQRRERRLAASAAADPQQQHNSGNGRMYVERRATHNATERARRERLNIRMTVRLHFSIVPQGTVTHQAVIAFQMLASLLPDIAPGEHNRRQPSRLAIANSCITHIHAARRHRARTAECLRTMIAERAQLRAELNTWREKAGLDPIPASDHAGGELDEDARDVFERLLRGDELEFEVSDLPPSDDGEDGEPGDAEDIRGRPMTPPSPSSASSTPPLPSAGPYRTGACECAQCYHVQQPQQACSAANAPFSHHAPMYSEGHGNLACGWPQGTVSTNQYAFRVQGTYEGPVIW